MLGRIKRTTLTQNKLPILGKIKIGIKNEQKGYPMSLDYFVAEGKYAQYFNNVFGEKPQSIEIVFISDNPYEVCNERYECRDKDGRLAGYGDGENFYLFNQVTNEYEIQPDKETLKKSGKWEATLTLTFIIPKISTVFGQWQLTTKGKDSSIPAIRDTFDSVLSIAGTVKNIPFDFIFQKSRVEIDQPVTRK